MTNSIVRAETAVSLVGGGAATVSDVQEALSLAPRCVAVDGGLALALAAGATPEAVIGDFDSVAPHDLAQVPVERRHPIAEQNSTDFEKALTRTRAPLILGVGFLGGRIDHQLAALHTLLRCPLPCILLGGAEAVLHLPPQLDLPCAPGDVVSLFPLVKVTGISTGLVWPIGGLTFAPGQQIGTSNAATGPVHLHMDGPGMIGIVPRRLLPALMSALISAPRHGPRAAL